jgi:hypothetical protein
MYGLSVDQNFQQVKIFRSSDLTAIMSLLQLWAYCNSELTVLQFWAYCMFEITELTGAELLADI